MLLLFSFNWTDAVRLGLDRNLFAHTAVGAHVHNHYIRVIVNIMWQDLQVKLPMAVRGEPVPYRSLQNGTYVTENKCWPKSAWQAKKKHMQRNMIMLISCQRLCLQASYVNYTTGYVCSAWLCWDPFQSDGFAEIHFMTTRASMTYWSQNRESNHVCGWLLSGKWHVWQQNWLSKVCAIWKLQRKKSMVAEFTDIPPENCKTAVKISFLILITSVQICTISADRNDYNCI